MTAFATRSTRGRAHDGDGQRRPRPLGAPPAGDALLDVRNLKTYFHVMDGTVPAVDGVSLQPGARQDPRDRRANRARGKSVTALTIMRLLDIPPAEIVEGEVWFDGQEILLDPDRADAQDPRQRRWR